MSFLPRHHTSTGSHSVSAHRTWKVLPQPQILFYAIPTRVLGMSFSLPSIHLNTATSGCPHRTPAGQAACPLLLSSLIAHWRGRSGRPHVLPPSESPSNFPLTHFSLCFLLTVGSDRTGALSRGNAMRYFKWGLQGSETIQE